jgi:hypothetical protein
LFDTRNRAHGVGLATSTNWFANLLLAYLAHDYFREYERHSLVRFFFSFAAVAITGTIFVWSFVPETNGRILGDFRPAPVLLWCSKRAQQHLQQSARRTATSDGGDIGGGENNRGAALGAEDKAALGRLGGGASTFSGGPGSRSTSWGGSPDRNNSFALRTPGAPDVRQQHGGGGSSGPETPVWEAKHGEQYPVIHTAVQGGIARRASSWAAGETDLETYMESSWSDRFGQGEDRGDTVERDGGGDGGDDDRRARAYSAYSAYSASGDGCFWGFLRSFCCCFYFLCSCCCCCCSRAQRRMTCRRGPLIICSLDVWITVVFMYLNFGFLAADLRHGRVWQQNNTAPTILNRVVADVMDVVDIMGVFFNMVNVCLLFMFVSRGWYVDDLFVVLK